jgi:hypothetical protein
MTLLERHDVVAGREPRHFSHDGAGYESDEAQLLGDLPSSSLS